MYELLADIGRLYTAAQRANERDDYATMLDCMRAIQRLVQQIIDELTRLKGEDHAGV